MLGAEGAVPFVCVDSLATKTFFSLSNSSPDVLTARIRTLQLVLGARAPLFRVENNGSHARMLPDKLITRFYINNGCQVSIYSSEEGEERGNVNAPV